MIKSFLKFSLASICILSLANCSSRSVLPDKAEIKVSRNDADKDCREIGVISGTTLSTKGTEEQALEDLKQVAANKGANYVKIQQYSAQGTTVTGTAYDCP